MQSSILEAEKRLHFTEVFAGDQNLSSGLRMLGYTGMSIDKRYSMLHDFMTKSGFLIVLAAVWRIVPGGVIHLAPPCSNFIMTSMGSTGRSKKDYGPQGNEGLIAHNIYIYIYIYRRDCLFV